MRQVDAAVTSVSLVAKTIAEVTQAYPGSDVGCALTWEYTSNGYAYVMWAAPHDVRQSHRLLASATDGVRLAAHWEGFVENVRKRLAQMG